MKFSVPKRQTQGGKGSAMPTQKNPNSAQPPLQKQTRGSRR